MKSEFGLFLFLHGMVAAGTGFYVLEESPTYSFLRKNTVNEHATGIVRVSGKSMEPAYYDGDYVYYKEIDSAAPASDVIVDTDDGAVIKRLNSDHQLQSINPSFPYDLKTDETFASFVERFLERCTHQIGRKAKMLRYLKNCLRMKLGSLRENTGLMNLMCDDELHN